MSENAESDAIWGIVQPPLREHLLQLPLSGNRCRKRLGCEFSSFMYDRATTLML